MGMMKRFLESVAEEIGVSPASQEAIEEANFRLRDEGWDEEPLPPNPDLAEIVIRFDGRGGCCQPPAEEHWEEDCG